MKIYFKLLVLSAIIFLIATIVLDQIGGVITNTIVTSVLGALSIAIVIAIITAAIYAYTKLISQSQNKNSEME